MEAAISVARERSGTQFDPDLVQVFCEAAPAVLGGLDSATTWDAVIAAEPGSGRGSTTPSWRPRSRRSPTSPT